MTTVAVGTVDVFVLARSGGAWHVLLLQRGPGTRCPGSWEVVHGHIEPGEEPEQAARRELREETSLPAVRLYSIRVQPIYLVRTHTVQLGVGFAAIVSEAETVVLGGEHVTAEWLSADEALRRCSWPADRAGLRDCLDLLAQGDAGPLEDVLRVV